MAGNKTNNRKLIVFETDNTILKENFIDACAGKFVFDEEVSRLKNTEKDPVVLIKAVAKLFSGLAKGDLLKVLGNIPLIEDTGRVIKKLREQGHIVGILTNGFQFVAHYIKNKFGLDFAVGNRLHFSNEIATGEITIPAYYYYHGGNKCDHNYCKTNALVCIAENYGIPVADCIAIGSNNNDRCIMEQSGTGIAFCSKDNHLINKAAQSITKPSFEELLQDNLYIKKKAAR